MSVNSLKWRVWLYHVKITLIALLKVGGIWLLWYFLTNINDLKVQKCVHQVKSGCLVFGLWQCSWSMCCVCVCVFGDVTTPIPRHHLLMIHQLQQTIMLTGIVEAITVNKLTKYLNIWILYTVYVTFGLLCKCTKI